MAIDLDLERLLAPIAADAPSGRDLRYDSAFQALRQMVEANLSVPQDMDQPAAWLQRDFKKIRRDAVALLGTGRDLRVLTILAEALAATDGPAGLAAGLELVRRSLQDHWETIHPSLDMDETGPADQAALRLNALRSLAADEDMLPELARMPLVSAPGVGGLSLRDADLASGRSNPLAYETRPEPGATEIVLRSAAPEAITGALTALEAAAGELRAIDELLAVRIGDVGALPDLSPLGATIARMRALLAPHAVARAPAADAEEARAAMAAGAVTGVSPAVEAATTGRLPAGLDSRDDVLRALELVIDYYRRREPGSAVPLLVERAHRMVPMTFMEAIGDLAPDAVARIQDLLGPPA
jgi:type VI secretion system protein ImpA